MGATLLLTLGALLAFLCWQFYVIGADIADPRGQPRSWGWVTLATGPIGILLLYVLLEDKRQPTQAPPSKPPTRRSPRSQPAVAPSPAQQPEAPPADEPPQEEPPEPPPTDEPPEEPPPRPIQRH